MKTFRARWQYLRRHAAFRRAPQRVLWRLAEWRCRCLLCVAATVDLPRWAVRMYLPPQWRGIAKLIFAFREAYEPELEYLDRLLTEGERIVDVGASLGIYTLVSARLVGDAGQVFAFEPARETFRLLQRNVLLNQLSNVRLFNHAVGDEEAVRRLYHYPDPGRNSLGSGVLPAIGVEDVAMTTLDLTLDREGVSHVDLVKADVEGAEELVFRGARNVLCEARPTVIFEVNPAAAEALGLAPVGAWQVLESMGYRFWTLHSAANLGRLESPPNGGNVVAIHRSA